MTGQDAIHHLGSRFPLDIQRGRSRVELRVGHDADDRFLVVGDEISLLLTGILIQRDVAVHFRELGDHIIGIDVAHDQHRLVAGMIPVVIETDQALRLEGFQALLGTDERIRGILGALEEILETLLPDPPGRIPARPALFQDDAPLIVDLLRVVRDETGIVMHDQQGRIHHALPHRRNAGQLIRGLLHAGRRIDVPAEMGALVLKIGNNPLPGEVLGAVQAHVLQEMGQTILVRILLDGTDIGQEIEVRPLRRLLIVPDIIDKAVLQFAVPDLGIPLQLFAEIDLRAGSQSEQYGCDSQKESLHIKSIKVFLRTRNDSVKIRKQTEIPAPES